MSKLAATWVLELNTECPGCKEHVNLLDYADFWDGRSIRACEHGTPAAKDVDVVCPECGHEFVVDLEY